MMATFRSCGRSPRGIGRRRRERWRSTCRTNRMRSHPRRGVEPQAAAVAVVVAHAGAASRFHSRTSGLGAGLRRSQRPLQQPRLRRPRQLRLRLRRQQPQQPLQLRLRWPPVGEEWRARTARQTPASSWVTEVATSASVRPELRLARPKQSGSTSGACSAITSGGGPRRRADAKPNGCDAVFSHTARRRLARQIFMRRHRDIVAALHASDVGCDI